MSTELGHKKYSYYQRLLIGHGIVEDTMQKSIEYLLFGDKLRQRSPVHERQKYTRTHRLKDKEQIELSEKLYAPLAAEFIDKEIYTILKK